MTSDANLQLFERREYKFLLRRELVPRVRDAITGVCKLDRYAGPDGTYPIRSLYFDTDDLRLFWANEREQGERFKVRARTYPGVSDVVFLEVKRRVIDIIVKTRVGVPIGEWARLVSDPAAMKAADLPGRGQRFGEHFAALVHGYHLTPKISVEYDREAYVSLIDDYARATFDLRIRSQLHESLDLDADPRHWKMTDHSVRTQTHEPMCVLELKFASAAPPWMSSLVRRFDLLRYEFSKYCYGLWEQHTLPTSRTSPLLARRGWP